MKIAAALIVSLGFLYQGSALAAGANDTNDTAAKKTVAYDYSTAGNAQSVETTAAKSCRDGNCAMLEEVKSCGAYVASADHTGYGFGSSKAAATSKANQMCGPGNKCQVVVAECED